MKEYTMTHKETTLLKQLLKALQENPNLADELRQAGMDPEFLQDPQDVCYMLDKPKANPKDSMYDLLDAHLEHFRQEEGEMETQTTDTWGRYPLEAMIRLIWRMRHQDGEITFMRGNAGVDSPPIFWYAQIQWEHNDRVLRCFDECHSNFMYLVIESTNYTITPQKFTAEMRDLLNFPEDAVWISRETITRITEVER